MLKSSSEDRMLGLRPLGSISLSLAFAYFAVVFLGGVTLVILPFGFSDIALLAIFVAVGAIMFFLPLNSVHKKMQTAKRLEQSSIREQFNQIVKNSDEKDRGDPQGALFRIEKLLAIQMLDQKASATATWPLDTSILSRFTAIILSVVAILVARFSGNVLHL